MSEVKMPPIDGRMMHKSESSVSSKGMDEALAARLLALKQKGEGQREEAEEMMDLAERARSLKAALMKIMANPNPSPADKAEAQRLTDEIGRIVGDFSNKKDSLEEGTHEFVVSSNQLGEETSQTTDNLGGMTNGWAAQAMSILRQLINVDIELQKLLKDVQEINRQLQKETTEAAAITGKAIGLDEANKAEVDGDRAMNRCYLAIGSMGATGVTHLGVHVATRGLEAKGNQIADQQRALQGGGVNPAIEAGHLRAGVSAQTLDDMAKYQKGFAPPTDLRQQQALSFMTQKEQLAASQAFDKQAEINSNAIRNKWSQKELYDGVWRSGEQMMQGGFEKHFAGLEADVARDKAEDTAAQTYAQQTVNMVNDLVREQDQKGRELAQNASRIYEADMQALISKAV